MSLVFSCTVPHPVNLLPIAGQENNLKLKKTKSAILNIADYLYAAKPDSLIIITPHLPGLHQSFVVNLSQKYLVTFDQYGDKETALEFEPDSELISLLAERVRTEERNIQLINQQELDHGSTIPLYLLTKHLPEIRILPIGSSKLSFADCFEFGKLIQREIVKSNRRVAVVSSCGLSHRLTKNAPYGFSAKGEEFDSLVRSLLKERNTSGLLSIDEKLAQEARECGFRSILVNLGILDNIDFQPEEIAYEHPFGIGYLTEYFALK